MSKFSKVIVAGVVFGGLLAGCGSNEQVSGNDESVQEPSSANQKDVSNKKEEVKKDENGRTVLEEAGQTIEDENGKLELLKIKKVNETIDLSPVKMTIKDIKIFKRSDIPQQLADELNSMYDQSIDPKEGFVYLQVGGDVENTEDKNVSWNGLNTIVTDKGQQIDGVFDDFISDNNELPSNIMGKVNGIMYGGYVLKDADINNVKLIFAPVYDYESYEEITPEQQVEYKFE
ncbi:hypothetical protein [Pseudalkalibacillus hwajinpoensis]|uniref:Lipoprotein n=1 Tax=Guptibacillus hwajinpoensis TaxID=208199 RepID=A0A4U1MMK1_9BACL|nr:hypothetical protein [Pseudalkalibacillus hwajinpoensis]TKD72187.1 hypothetical protein FBF83_05165 [Pseudalkalibacillus hwajinpoensis]